MEYTRFHEYILCSIEYYGRCYIEKKTLGDDRYLTAMRELLTNGDIILDQTYRTTFVVIKNKNFNQKDDKRKHGIL